jgi:uncharacterized OB-fold protein
LDAPDAPTSDADSAAYWAGLSNGVLLLQHCTDCGRRRFPPMPTCPYCASRQFVEERASGRGSVYSWVGVDHPFDERFAAEVPYVVAIVELAEGPRLAARLDSQPVIGAPVEARFVRHGSWTELRFAALAAA